MRVVLAATRRPVTVVAIMLVLVALSLTVFVPSERSPSVASGCDTRLDSLVVILSPNANSAVRTLLRETSGVETVTYSPDLQEELAGLFHEPDASPLLLQPIYHAVVATSAAPLLTSELRGIDGVIAAQSEPLRGSVITTLVDLTREHEQVIYQASGSSWCQQGPTP